MDTTTPTQDPPTTADTTLLGQPLVAYGDTCSWWGPVASAGVVNGHPACPCCDGRVSLVDEEAWETMVQQAADQNADLLVDVGDGSYQAFVTWLRGRCFPSIAKAAEAYRATTGSNLDELAKHALPADAPGAWIRDAIDAAAQPAPVPVPVPVPSVDPMRAAEDFLVRYLHALDAPAEAAERRTVAEAHTVVDMLGRILDQDNPLYRIEKSAPLVDAALSIELEAYRRLAGDTDLGVLLDEAAAQVEHLHRHVRAVMLAIAGAVDVPRSAIADLDAHLVNAGRWVRSIEALRGTKDGDQ